MGVLMHSFDTVSEQICLMRSNLHYGSLGGGERWIWFRAEVALLLEI